MINLKNTIESLLFISHKPLSIKDLAKLAGATAVEVKSALDDLDKEYSDRSGGIQLNQLNDKYQFTTTGDASEVVARFIKSEVTGELARPSLETLTIIAYRGPISKAELEIIRGVNCSLILRNLMIRGLIEAKEDKKQAIVYYDITFDFLKHLGLKNKSELPDFEKLNRNHNLDKLLAGAEKVGTED